MTNKQLQLQKELQAAAHNLTTMLDLALSTAPDRVEEMCRVSLDSTKHVLEQLGGVTGLLEGRRFREEDCRVEEYQPASPIEYGERNRGIAVKHIPTGIRRESYTQETKAQNKAIAMSALEEVVNERYGAT